MVASHPPRASSRTTKLYPPPEGKARTSNQVAAAAPCCGAVRNVRAATRRAVGQPWILSRQLAATCRPQKPAPEPVSSRLTAKPKRSQPAPEMHTLKLTTRAADKQAARKPISDHDANTAPASVGAQRRQRLLTGCP